jgi:cyclopropane-fatty-acyl-phospholipid synthase
MSADLTVASNPLRRRGTGTARLARQAMRAKLRGLKHGRLTVSDPWGQWTVGTGEENVEIAIIDPAFYLDVALEGSLGAARAWMDRRWHTEELTAVLRLLLRNIELVDSMEGGVASLTGLLARGRHWLRRNSLAGSQRNIRTHYDLGNEFFALFLDESMTYSAGIFEREDATLEDAQFAKLDLICRKLDLTAEDHVLEIGTGWGSFAIHAARHYGCRVTSTTISHEQHALALARVKAAGLNDRVTVLLNDYRDLDGCYDKLVSIEMIEAVGHAFLPTYFAACARLLRADGAMLLQGITMPDQRYDQYLKSSDFIQEYIFPGSCCPALTAILNAVAGHSDFKVSHLEDIGLHYVRTLREWRARLEHHEAQVQALGYPERFVRMWRYYLAYCEAGFAERYTGTVQLLLEKPDRRTLAKVEKLAGPERVIT